MWLMAKTYTPEEVLKSLAARIAKSSLRQTAVHYGVSAAYLSDVMRGKRDVSKKLSAALGLTRTVAVSKVITFERVK